MTKIHPTALVDSDSKLGEGVEIGAFAVVSAGVVLGDGCRVLGHAQILPGVALGGDCEVGHGAVIGGDPQDLKFDRETISGVEIGAGTVFREHVTVHRGSREGSMTRIGEGNFLMAGAHVGHDVQMGDHNVMANNCLLGGEVQVGSQNFFGGGSAFHQFVRVGDLAMVKGLTAISQDVPPFVMVSGSNQVRGLNVVGMTRAGFERDQRVGVKAAFNHIYRGGMNLSQALAAAQHMEWGREAGQFIEFFQDESKKGVCRLGA
ncbi:MAG: UDP-N-acetylglucosamine acyltransferase [Verrucomicrobiales bacterium]|jgi:UDP-N-acetylglucosamine acyltransferase